MFKFVVLAALMAVAAAKPGFIGAPGVVAYSAPVVAQSVVASAPIAYTAQVARVAAPVAYSAPIARVAAPVSIPAPVTYTGAEVRVEAEPVEQHGYKIVY